MMKWCPNSFIYSYTEDHRYPIYLHSDKVNAMKDVDYSECSNLEQRAPNKITIGADFAQHGSFCR